MFEHFFDDIRNVLKEKDLFGLMWNIIEIWQLLNLKVVEPLNLK